MSLAQHLPRSTAACARLVDNVGWLRRRLAERRYTATVLRALKIMPAHLSKAEAIEAANSLLDAASVVTRRPTP